MSFPVNLSARTSSLPALTLAALGVVFGDIGTSPLYAFKEAFSPAHGLPLTELNVYAVLSMIFWSVMIIVTCQYVLVTLRFDYEGEGGVLALLSFCTQQIKNRRKLVWLVTMIGIFAVSLFYGDAVVTPAISVLSAVEGVREVAPGLHGMVLPLSIGIIVGLFLIQCRGTGSAGAWFGPVMLLWFAVLAVLGVTSIAAMPEILWAVSPHYAWNFLISDPKSALVAAGAVFLCVTGAEALYADMGHFGRRPMQVAWFLLVLPALLLNYFGQGALVLRHPELIRNPFYLLAKEEWQVPLIILATLSTVIASQATISGAFSATQQASRLGFLPRFRVWHTSDSERGQIYIPLVNWLLLILVLALVLGFHSSAALASAYGIAVAGDLVLASLMMLLVLPFVQSYRLRWLWFPFLIFFSLEAGFLAANVVKIRSGGWFPLFLALVVFTLLSAWRRGMEILRAHKDTSTAAMIDPFAIDFSSAIRIPGTAVFFASSRFGCPSAFLNNLRHNKVVHDKTLFLMVEFDDTPYVHDAARMEILKGENGLVRVNVHLGYRELADVKLILSLLQRRGLGYSLEDTSFFMSKPALIVNRSGIFGWQRSLFGWMLYNSTSVSEYFNLPPDRVVELGVQLAI